MPFAHAGPPLLGNYVSMNLNAGIMTRYLRPRRPFKWFFGTTDHAWFAPRLAVTVQALRAIKAMGLATAILSNGNSSMLESVVAAAGLADALDEVISVDEVRQFKTSPLAYALIERRMKTPPGKVLFVSSNAWDALGASWQGLRVFWVNRAKLPFEEIGPRPWATGASLADLPPLLAGR